MSPTSFRAEYRRSGGGSMFARNVKFQVDMAATQMGEGPTEVKMHCVTFTLLSGKMHHSLCYIHSFIR